MRTEVAGARLPEKGTAIVEEAARLGEEMGVTVQLTDARLVCGKEHLEVAAEKALRARERGRMTARALAAEVLLYASGERQIQKAIGKMGVRDDTTEVGVMALGEVDAKDILEALGLEPDDTVLEASPEKLAAYGISPKELEAVDSDQAADLVLERVALVDLMK